MQRHHGAAILPWILALGACNNEPPGEPVRRTRTAQNVVDTVCAAFVNCDCATGTNLENNTDCNSAILPSMEAAMANAQDLGLRYHANCLSRVEDYIKLLQCKAPDEVDFQEEDLRQALYDVEHCKLLSGPATRGQGCQMIASVAIGTLGDNCADGLVCDGSLCRPLPNEQGDWCGGWLTCPPSLRCLDPEGDGVQTCEPPAIAGQPCNPHDGAGCAEDHYCDVDDLICKSLPGQDEECLNGQCQQDLVCMTNMCAALPGVGEDCPDFVCTPGNACDPMTGTCTALPSEGEDCLMGQCDLGLGCDMDNVCVKQTAIVCGLAASVGLCHYEADGICDEPSGTGLCEEGTDPVDCSGNSGGATGGVDPTGGDTEG